LKKPLQDYLIILKSSLRYDITLWIVGIKTLVVG